MPTISNLTKENFNALLNWLSSDSEKAGVEYERIRNGLINFFRYRGCADSDMLADETINRVAMKLDQYDLSKDISKMSFFYGFAKNLIHEYFDQLKIDAFSEEKHQFYFAKFTETDEPENVDLKCLDKCLSKLKAADRKFIISYYSEEKGEKIETRKIIAKKFNLSVKGIHTKAFRVRESLKTCILNCFKAKIVK